MWDHSYCSVPSQQTECDSRLEVNKQFRLLGMEAGSPVISENLSTEGNLETIYLLPDYLIRSRLTFRGDQIHWAKQQMSSNKICSARVFMHFPHFAWSQRFWAKSWKTKYLYDDPCTSSLATTTVVPRSDENVHTTINFIDLEERSLKKSKRFIPLSKIKL